MFVTPTRRVADPTRYYPTESVTVKLHLQNLRGELKIEQHGVTTLEQTVGSVVTLNFAYRLWARGCTGTTCPGTVAGSGQFGGRRAGRKG
jgi:hypothetical protein